MMKNKNEYKVNLMKRGIKDIIQRKKGNIFKISVAECRLDRVRN